MATLIDPNSLGGAQSAGEIASGPDLGRSNAGGGSNEGTSKTGGLTYPQVENIWIQAGGNPQAAAMAAAVADASSGFDPSITRTNPDGTTSVGLWLIPKNGQPPGSTDPMANARAAIQMSNNGTDWQQWCVAWSDNNCGQDGGSYLGDGSNALGSLAQRLTPASYNVIGSSPAGSGVGASSATSSGTTTGGQSSSGFSKVLLIIVLAGIAYVVVKVVRKRGAGPPPETPVGVVPDVQA